MSWKKFINYTNKYIILLLTVTTAPLIYIYIFMM